MLFILSWGFGRGCRVSHGCAGFLRTGSCVYRSTERVGRRRVGEDVPSTFMVVAPRPILQSGQAAVRWLVASRYDGVLENPLFCRPHVSGVQCDIHEASMAIPHMGQFSRLVKIAHGRKVRSLRRSSPWCGSAGPVCSTPSLFGGIPSDPGGSICARDPVHEDASAFSRLDVGTIRNRRAVPVERNPTEPGLQPRTTKEKPTGDPPKATSQEVETESPTNAEDWTPSKETV
eukprot:scaffold1554_cov332-Pavlova_lutheri.AAC.16